MAHDFARKKSRRGATGARKADTGQRKSPSAWAWLGAGLLTGGFVGLLVLLTLPDGQSPRENSPVAPLEGSTDSTSSDEPRFAFYTLLPESEVLIAKKETESTAVQAPARPTPASTLLLQAGSFRIESDADRRRAELLLLGFDAIIKRVQVDDATTWHRVQVGPFANRSQIANARQRLANERIDSLLITQRN